MSSKFKKIRYGEIKGKKRYKELIKALKYEDSNIRMFAAIALGEIGDERAISTFDSIFKRWKEEVQNEA